MKADTFATLVVLETLMDAEVGFFLRQPAGGLESFREALVARVSDLVDEIDERDAVAAARVYDAIVDFLAQLGEDPEQVVEASLRFKRALDRLVERGLSTAERGQASTWAVVLDELLGAVADEYHMALRAGAAQPRPREWTRVQALLSRAREAADRMLWQAGEEGQTEARNEMDRLTFALRYQRLKPTAADFLIRTAQRRARRYRPSTLTRVGSFVLGQLLRRQPRAS